MKKIVILLCCLFSSYFCLADEPVTDPFDSVQWADMSSAFLQGKAIQFDDRVKVKTPSFAENPMNVPVSVDATELENIEQIIIFADFNPIPLIARYYPFSAEAKLSFRFKIQQSSPVRAAVLTKDQVWHVGGARIDSAGGGCTVASTGRLAGDWADKLGEVYGKRWLNPNNDRVRFLINHPMDTGLVSGIPAFFIEELSFMNEHGDLLARIELFEPINENPVLTFDFKTKGSRSDILMVGLDNNGNEFSAEFKP